MGDLRPSGWITVNFAWISAAVSCGGEGLVGFAKLCCAGTILNGAYRARQLSYRRRNCLVVPLGKVGLNQPVATSLPGGALASQVTHGRKCFHLPVRTRGLVTDNFRRPEKERFAASTLELELTESVVIRTAKVGRTVSDNSRLGISSAIDDFGTGYSSFSSICKIFPSIRSKIDQSFSA